MPHDENDWLFDFVLQFLESDLFDSAVMDFVDEKCEIFDNEEENKFAYTDIHREFRDHVDALLSSNLGELGVTPELFYEACAKGRNSRDINRAVYDKMIAMDDFQTFKKIMVKRNMELQMEAIRSMKEASERDVMERKMREEEEDKVPWHFLWSNFTAITKALRILTCFIIVSISAPSRQAYLTWSSFINKKNLSN